MTSYSNYVKDKLIKLSEQYDYPNQELDAIGEVIANSIIASQMDTSIVGDALSWLNDNELVQDTSDWLKGNDIIT
ncbi:MAG: hypothetical protein EO766_11675 [Hydrotalea sp. AMD]|uniref:hypothetical protein n=1 Tax=Hydrotalea sp. AMD TaxID=2501297 RepID=UPI0010261463|nr:hypothetical protein [Hydrotalea sp. AMD]RWZ87188.1 MAG: hypothetical protein EO766_11675 [Hydrotalea sp. AMD]